MVHNSFNECFLTGHNLVADTWEGVVLAHNTDNGLSAAPLRCEGGGHAGDPGLDIEAVLLKGLCDELAALVFVEPVLRSPR
jgi:hypothetical protein